MSHETAGAGVFAVLELLAREAPAEDLETLVEEAERKGASLADLKDLEHAKQLGMSIYARFDRGNQREARLSSLVDTVHDLSMPNELGPLLKITARRARQLLGLDTAFVSFPDERAGHYRIMAADGNASMLSMGLRLPGSTRCLAGKGTSDPAPFWTPDYLHDDRFERNPLTDDVIRAEGLHAMIGMPLNQGPHRLGMLYGGDRSIRHFAADEISLLGNFAELAGVVIEKVRLIEQTTAAAAELEAYQRRAEAGLSGIRELSDLSHQLLDTALGGGDVHELAKTASELLDSVLLVSAGNGTVLTTAGGTMDEAGTALVAATMAAHTARRAVPLDGGRWAAPVTAGRDNLGTLVLRPNHPFTEQDQQLLRLICQAMAVVLLQENSTRAVAEGRLRDELLEELLDDPTQSTQRFESRTRRLGIDLGSPHLVIIARPEGGGQGKAAIWASSYARRLGGLRCVHKGCVVLLIPGKDAGDAASVVCDELTPILGHPVTVSAAGPISGADDVWRGFLEAQRCLDAMTVFGATGRSASARQLGFLGLLLADNHDVEGFIDSVVGPVVDYDRQRFTDLIRTLETYFDAGASPTKAAKVLHVHPNTVARRLERISELLGSGWQEPERLLEIQLALRLARIRHGLHDQVAVPGELSERF